MQFDARRAKGLQAGDHMTVPDAPGLRLVCSTAGRAWTYRYKSPTDGRMRQIKIGMWPTMSAAQAGAEWDRLRQAQRIDPATGETIATLRLRGPATAITAGTNQPETVSASRWIGARLRWASAIT